MNANFTEESCTGTGNVLTLTGPTTGNIGFAAAFQNGDSVRYSVYDADGVTKAAGIGVYSAGTITRNDTWSFDGVVDNSPASNITLSAGTHTVRCSLLASDGDKLDAIEPAATKGAGALGIAPASVSVDTTLTALSPGYQVVAVGTSGDINITLPDATTVTNSAIVYILENNGDGDLYVKNDSGTVIARVSSGQRIGINLTDGTTADGVWASFGFNSGSVESSGLTSSNATTFHANQYTAAGSVTSLTSTKALAVYYDGSSSSMLAIVLDISGTTITPGAPQTVEATQYIDLTAIRISDTQVMIAYQNQASSGDGQARLLDVAGTAITVNGAVTYNTGYASGFHMDVLTPSTVMVLYVDDQTTTFIRAVVLTITGSSLSAGTSIEVVNSWAGSPDALDVVALTSTKVLVFFSWGTLATDNGGCVTLDVAGTVITRPLVAQQIGTPDYPYAASLRRISDTKALLVHQDSANSNRGIAATITVAGNSFTLNAYVSFGAAAAAANDINVEMLSPDRALVTYRQGATNDGMACILNIAGDVVTPEAAITWDAGDADYNKLSAINSSSGIIIYQDDPNLDHGKSRILTYASWQGY